MSQLINEVTHYWNDVYHYNLLQVFCHPEKELVNHTFFLENPTDRRIFSIARNFNEKFGDMMFEWIMDGGVVPSAEMLEMNPSAKNYKTFYAQEGVPLHVTAYGPRIVEQLPYVYRLLEMTEGTSRRAEIMILTPQDIHVAIARERGLTTCEYPCTLGFNFRVRRGQLEMITSMRSNNYVTTVNQDVWVFTRLQELIAAEIGVDVGRYYHYAQSAHILPGNEDRARAILEEYCDRLDWQFGKGTSAPWLAIMEDC